MASMRELVRQLLGVDDLRPERALPIGIVPVGSEPEMGAGGTVPIGSNYQMQPMSNNRSSISELAMDLLSRAGSGPVLQPTNVFGQDPDLPIGYGEGEISPLDAAAMSTMLVPGVGDVTGLAADVDMYMRDPESRNIPNYLLTAAGVLPFLPAASQVRKGIKAYHGSPHSFDRFSTEQIGTGEGAQQYGRGLYFAENEKVAKEYRDQLTPRDLDYEDWLMGKYKNAERNQDYARMEMYERAMLNQTPQDFKDLAADVDYDDDYRELAAEVGKEIEEYGPNLGRMYEVNIDVEPDELLQWDIPISQQSEKVQDAVYANRDAVDQRIVDDYFGGDRNNIINEDMTGQQYMANMDKVNAGVIDGTEYELAERGVKGIRYADAFTRHKTPDKRSMNYVIFDDRLITIAKKYGVAIPVAAAMLAKATGEDTSQSYQEET